MKKRKTKKRNEVRIINIPDSTFENLKNEAKENCRSIQKQVLHDMITQYV